MPVDTAFMRLTLRLVVIRQHASASFRLLVSMCLNISTSIFSSSADGIYNHAAQQYALDISKADIIPGS